MFDGSSYLCVFVLWSGQFLELLFAVFSEKTVVRRPVGNCKQVVLARR